MSTKTKFLTEAVIKIEDHKRKKRLLQRIKTLDEMLRWIDRTDTDFDKVVNNIYQKHLGTQADIVKNLRHADVDKLTAISKELKQELDKHKEIA